MITFFILDRKLETLRTLTSLSKVIGFSHLQCLHRQPTLPKFFTSSLVLFSRKPSAFKISLADWISMTSVEGGRSDQWSPVKTTCLMTWSTISGYPYTFLNPSHVNLSVHTWQVQKKRLIARPMILFLLTLPCEGSQTLMAFINIASNWGTNVFFPSSTIFSWVSRDARSYDSQPGSE